MSGQQTYYSGPRGFPGLIVGDDGGNDSVINDTGSAAQVATIAIDSETAEETYTFKINGYTVTHTTGEETPTKAEIRDALIAAAYLVPELEGVVTFTASGEDVRVTAAVPGTAFVVSGEVETTTTATTANVATQYIPFGRAVVKRTGGNSTDQSVALPSADAQLFMGVALREPTASDGSAGHADAVAPLRVFSIRRRGDVWVEVDQAVAVGDPVAFRYATDSGEGAVGTFRKDVDTNQADVVTGAMFMTSTTGAGLAIARFK